MVSLSDYEKLLDNRPKKFSAKQVNFRKAEDDPPCASCVHWFLSPMRQHSVCEIFRPATADELVPPDWTCDFQTADGQFHPNYRPMASDQSDGEGVKVDDEHS